MLKQLRFAQNWRGSFYEPPAVDPSLRMQSLALREACRYREYPYKLYSLSIFNNIKYDTK